MPVVTIPDENRTCAVDEPSSVTSLAGVGGFADVAQCAMRCTGVFDCSGFNVKFDMRLCEIFSYIATLFALVPDCEYRQASRTRTPDNPRVTKAVMIFGTIGL